MKLSRYLKRIAHLPSWILISFVILLVVFVFSFGILNRQQTWADLNYSDVHIYPSSSLRITDGDSYGIVSSGPGYRLPAGQYRVKLSAETDGSSTVYLTDSNDVQMTPNSMPILAGESTHEMYFDIPNAVADFQIQISFDSGTYLDVYDVRLYSPFYQDHAFTFVIILIILLTLLLMYNHNAIDRAGIQIFVLLSSAVIICSAPVLKDNLTELIDLEFHMTRIENLADGLKSGQFPVRAGGFSFNGYGAITSVFYPDLLLIPFALLRLLGASPTYVIAIFCICCSALSAITAYFAGKRIFNNVNAGVCTAILYVCCVYRLNNLYIRGALGEGLAMSFYPLFIEGLWDVIYGDKKQWRVLTAGAFLIFMSHLITTVMAALIAIGVCVLSIPKIIREKRILPLGKAALATVGLSVFFLIPMGDMMSKGINADIINIYRLQDKTIAPAQLFLQSRGLLPVLADPTIDTGAVELGFPVVLGVILTLIWLCSEKEDVSDWTQKVVIIFMLLGILFAFMTTTLFPWAHISRITTFFNRIQFAWRFIGPAVALLCISGGFACQWVMKRKGNQLPIMLLCISILTVLPTLSEQCRRGSFFRFGEGTSGVINYYEYQLEGTELQKIVDRGCYLSKTLEMKDYDKKGTQITAKLYGSGTASFPLFAFDGYEAEIDGILLKIERGENNRVQISVPQTDGGNLRIWYKGRIIWKVADFVSLISLLVLCISSHWIRKSHGNGKELIRNGKMK